jgi:hypothetical protein
MACRVVGSTPACASDRVVGSVAAADVTGAIVGAVTTSHMTDRVVGSVLGDGDAAAGYGRGRDRGN